MIDNDYESTEEAWQSGYDAALHNDLPAYLGLLCPWWCPKWVWVRSVRRAFVWARVQRGEDL